ncbi:MAG: amidohydrolase family protein [Oscillospiraceae bacterium]|nr:amidohydrolase family protein [Oscillospiraceae bacterium]
MIIDAHVHIYPEKIADKAVSGIRDFYSMHIEYDGRISTLLREGKAAGVDKFIVQSVATVFEQVCSINNFIAQSVSDNPELIGFGTMHPDFPEIPKEVDRMISLGLKGIKLHSDFQRFAIDDERAFQIYEAAEGRLPILFHMGDTKSDLSAPERLLKVVKKFPRLTVIGAHFAGWSMWDRAESALSGTGIYTDCSSALYALSPERAVELIHKFGADKVLWGTDYPMWNYEDEFNRFNKLALTENERGMILGKNAWKLLTSVK